MKRVEISSNVFITPPNDDHITDEDFGEKDGVTINNLLGIQPTSEAYVEDGVKNDISITIKKSINSKKMKIGQWKSEDIRRNNDNICYPCKLTASDKQITPCEVFQLFMNGFVIDHLVKETVKYAIHRSNRSFELCNTEMKTFLGILIVSGYCSVPRRRLYWQAELIELIANSMF